MWLFNIYGIMKYSTALPSVSKIFERIIQKELQPFLCWYLKSFNTQYALLSLIEKWNERLDNKDYTGVILMDLSKTSGSIKHKLLTANYFPTDFQNML